MPFVNETLSVGVRANDPLTFLPIQPPVTCTFNFYAPTKNPITVPSDRTSPDHTTSGTYDVNFKGFTGSISTSGWAVGTWTYQAVLTSSYVVFDFATVTLS